MLKSPRLSLTSLKSERKRQAHKNALSNSPSKLNNKKSDSNPSTPTRNSNLSHPTPTTPTMPPPTPTMTTLYQPKLANALTFNPRQSHKPTPPTLQGNSTKYMDKVLSKLAFKIRGSVPSSNFITNNPRVPDLLLSGNFIYTILKPIPHKPLTIHFDFVTANNLPFRISVSTFFSALKTAGSTLRVPFSLANTNPSDDDWLILAIDVKQMIKKFAPASFHSDSISHLKATKSCSSMSLYGIFSSETIFTGETLCNEINISSAVTKVSEGGSERAKLHPLRNERIEGAASISRAQRKAERNGEGGFWGSPPTQI